MPGLLNPPGRIGGGKTTGLIIPGIGIGTLLGWLGPVVLGPPGYLGAGSCLGYIWLGPCCIPGGTLDIGIPGGLESWGGEQIGWPGGQFDSFVISDLLDIPEPVIQ